MSAMIFINIPMLHHFSKLTLQDFKEHLRGIHRVINMGDLLKEPKHLKKNDMDEIEQYKQALDKKPEDAFLYYKLGKAYAGLGIYMDAIEAYQHAIHMKEYFPEAYYQIGYLYGKLGKSNAAIKYLKAAIQMKKDYAEAHHMLGLMYLSKGDHHSAFLEYSVLKQLNHELAEELNTYIESDTQGMNQKPLN
jgi:tetratricopeptide (TPR) repeat protein